LTQITPQAHSNLVGGSTASRRKAHDVTYEEVRLFIDYDPHTGDMRWKTRDVEHFAGSEREADIAARKWNTKFAGKPAINSLSKGYLTGRIRYVQVYAHRLAWMHFHGENVEKGMYLDHVNGDRADNRIANLRVVTPRQSAFNLPPRSARSKHKGVYFDARRGHWYARIRVDGTERSLGRFMDEDAAAEAYRLAAELYQGAHAYHLSREEANA
jgi:hypothetical protein